ncbi:MAG: PfkB family carbohydrate kinase [Eubacteriales bacterium]|nr:PfkB family carbohydrate kinase [Eubacteriales bacterium]
MIKVLGLGDNVVDKYMHTKTMYPGGNALNIAVLAKLFGIESGYFGVFGDDAAAKHVYRTICDLGLDVSYCRFYHGENGYAEVRLDDGDRVFVGSNGGGVSKTHPIDTLTDMELDYIAGYDVCHTSIFSYAEEVLPALRKASPFLSFDFSNRYDEDYLKRCCPYIDMAAISCGDMPKEEIIAQMERIADYGCKHIVMATRGSKGAFLMVDGKFYEQSPCLVEAKDTMAAGDSFITSFLINYVDGMKDAVDFSEASGKRGVTEKETYQDMLVKTSLYRAAVFAAGNCQRDGSFGFGKKFE